MFNWRHVVREKSRPLNKGLETVRKPKKQWINKTWKSWNLRPQTSSRKCVNDMANWIAYHLQLWQQGQLQGNQSQEWKTLEGVLLWRNNQQRNGVTDRTVKRRAHASVYHMTLELISLHIPVCGGLRSRTDKTPQWPTAEEVAPNLTPSPLIYI